MIGRMQQPLLPGVPARISCAVTRRLPSPGGNERIVSRMVGFPQPGPPQPGLAVCGIALAQPTNPIQTVAAFPRPQPGSPGFQFEGHPEAYVLQVPPVPNFTGLPLVFVWAAFTGPTQQFDVTPPVRIVL